MESIALGVSLSGLHVQSMTCHDMSVKGFGLGHMLEGWVQNFDPGLVDAVGVAPQILVSIGGRDGVSDILKMSGVDVGALVGSLAGVVVDGDQATERVPLGGHGVLVVQEGGLVGVGAREVVQRVFALPGSVLFGRTK